MRLISCVVLRASCTSEHFGLGLSYGQTDTFVPPLLLQYPLVGLYTECRIIGSRSHVRRDAGRLEGAVEGGGLGDRSRGYGAASVSVLVFDSEAKAAKKDKKHKKDKKKEHKREKKKRKKEKRSAPTRGSSSGSDESEGEFKEVRWDSVEDPFQSRKRKGKLMDSDPSSSGSDSDRAEASGDEKMVEPAVDEHKDATPNPSSCTIVSADEGPYIQGRGGKPQNPKTASADKPRLTFASRAEQVSAVREQASSRRADAGMDWMSTDSALRTTERKKVEKLEEDDKKPKVRPPVLTYRLLALSSRGV
eukprot:6042017-Pyramimonas_sp.AAC.1